MIQDLFLRRYEAPLYYGDRPSPAIQRLFTQVAHIVFVDLGRKLRLEQDFFRQVHDGLAREMGVGRLGEGRTYDEVCGRFLSEPYDLWNNRHGSADTFLKTRLSLVELLFRAAEARVATPKGAAPAGGGLGGWRRAPRRDARQDEGDAAGHVTEAVKELNARFRQAAIGLHYHNGLLQFAQDQLTQEKLAEPCWTLLLEPRWANPDRELKEAFDRADAGRADAAFHAAKALESTIKIISDMQGWTSGAERGAANYIDNLVSRKNGRFIEPWEAELLKAYFVHVRNPQGHGAGSQAPPTLADFQTTWAIETAMSWMKSLIRRL